jgi:hypothetical protein
MSGSNSLPPADAHARKMSEPTREEPLTLTVHSLPTPSDALPRRTVMGRWKILALFLACTAPVIASYFTYYVIRPEGRRNYGELVNPSVALPDATAQTLENQVFHLSQLRNQWLLISVASGHCDAACEKNLYTQRQLRESLGRDKDRLDRVWLVSDDAPVKPALLPALQTPGSMVLRVAPEVLQTWLKHAPGQQLQDHLYVVDPMGQWMMRFPSQIDASKAKRDLDRLLRAAGSWDKAGR